MQPCQLYMATTKHLHCYIVQGMIALPVAPRALAHEAVVLGAVVMLHSSWLSQTRPAESMKEHRTTLLSGDEGASGQPRAFLHTL